MNTSKNILFLLLSLYFFVVSNILVSPCDATDEVTNLYKLLKSKRSKDFTFGASWTTLPTEIREGQVHVEPQDGLMDTDKITFLPGQPDGLDFDQYAGYVTVDPSEKKALFYYFAESPHNASSKPLVLWLTGGPGCSSFGSGALLELGPFKVRRDAKTLYQNHYSWNKVANVIFLESPAGVGFSRGNKSIIFEKTGDISTAKDAYTFLVNWFERFPQYKNRHFYLTGESYAGHYVPQLAYTILHNNKNAKYTFINLKGIAIGNPWIDDATDTAGIYDYLYNHALYSDETHAKIRKHCNFSAEIWSSECKESTAKASDEWGDIDIFNVYATTCQYLGQLTSEVYDPCSTLYVYNYLNIKEVQEALHTRPSKWQSCKIYDWHDSPSTVLPIIKKLISQNLSIWLYSGDLDGRVPVTSTKYSIKTLKLPIKTSWRPWYFDDQVGGYVVGYEGLVFVTVRGAGHHVPSYQPQRALTMISSFLNGTLPPM